jgi:hypothetical protein
MTNEKIKYEKPVCIDAGKVAPILGANCSTGASAGVCLNTGNGATGDCSVGYNNSVVPACQTGGAAKYCDPTGNSATYCDPVGNAPIRGKRLIRF